MDYRDVPTTCAELDKAYPNHPLEKATFQVLCVTDDADLTPVPDAQCLAYSPAGPKPPTPKPITCDEQKYKWVTATTWDPPLGPPPRPGPFGRPYHR